MMISIGAVVRVTMKSDPEWNKRWHGQIGTVLGCDGPYYTLDIPNEENPTTVWSGKNLTVIAPSMDALAIATLGEDYFA